jgi:hypothetical protein
MLRKLAVALLLLGSFATVPLLGHLAASAFASGPTYPVIATMCIDNRSEVSDAEVAAAAAAVQVQLDRDFARHYHYTAKIVMGCTDPTMWQVHVVNRLSSDAPDCFCFGFHDSDNSLPFMYVLTPSEWTVTLSHEILETMVDPVDTIITVHGVKYWYEIADPVEDYYYLINGVKVSDFVLPSWTGGAYPYNIDGVQVGDHVLPPWTGGVYPYDIIGVLRHPLEGFDPARNLVDSGVKK